jgi:hypothetical protein
MTWAPQTSKYRDVLVSRLLDLVMRLATPEYRHWLRTNLKKDMNRTAAAYAALHRQPPSGLIRDIGNES